MPRTRIVCTLGPASEGEEQIRALIGAGMSMARINFSHGTLDDHRRRVETLRRVAAQENAVVALLGDLAGPKLRVGNIAGGSIVLQPGATIRFVLGPSAEAGTVPLDLPLLGQVVKPGDRMLLNDGTKEVQVIYANASEIHARVITGGTLVSRKGVNLPYTSLPLPSLTENDRLHAQWAIEQEFDYLALSFVRSAADVVALRELVRAHNAEISIIAKIEKPEAVANLDAILRVSDGVMVARGDLGIEMPAEEVPITQKMIIRRANRLGLPVITATQMLESMIENPRPTRAEASDVANAVLDGSDAVMLSGETAIGKHPIEAARVMARIAGYAEHFLREEFSHCAGLSHSNQRPRLEPDQVSTTDAIGASTVELAQELGAKLIITLTSSGYTARMVARHRPATPILAVTTDLRICRRLALVWGVQTAVIPQNDATDKVVERALQVARDRGMVGRGDRVVITAGVPSGISGQTNMVQVRTID